MNELQALVTGVLAGSLVRAEMNSIAIDVEVVIDDAGNYQPEILVTGRHSGTRLRVSVDVIKEE